MELEAGSGAEGESGSDGGGGLAFLEGSMYSYRIEVSLNARKRPNYGIYEDKDSFKVSGDSLNSQVEFLLANRAYTLDLHR
jgi:hypothetical protein